MVAEHSSYLVVPPKAKYSKPNSPVENPFNSESIKVRTPPSTITVLHNTASTYRILETSHHRSPLYYTEHLQTRGPAVLHGGVQVD